MNGRQLRVLRALGGLSQAGLAEKLQISQKLVSCWETGRRPVLPKYVEQIEQVMRKR